MVDGHVFASYAREDTAYVDTLVRYLRGQGVEVWTDTAIYFGDRWPEVIEEKIDSCVAFVVVMSPAARESAWVGREVLHALEQGKRMFPLLLSGRKLFVVGNLQYEDVGHGGMPTQRWVDGLRAAVAGAGAGSAPAGGGMPHAGAPPAPGIGDVPTPDGSMAETATRRWWRQLRMRQPPARMSGNPAEAVGRPPRPGGVDRRNRIGAPAVSLRLRYAIRSDVGHVREGNEDSAYAGPSLLAVADGMGGHAAGEVASSTVISALANLDEEIPSDEILDALTESVRTANAQLRAMSMHDGSLEGMGTTITAMLFSGSEFGLLHVGGSRAYLLRDDELAQVTHDHTLVQDLVDQGRITPEQANTHPQRSLLVRALDGREVEPDLDVRQAVPGDRYLLCTDGLSGVVSVETILDALLLPVPQHAVDRLVELALDGGGPDNITVVVADVVDASPDGNDAPLVAGAAAEKEIDIGLFPG
jgi:serine/threonine protein phosphatase PrpC